MLIYQYIYTYACKNGLRVTNGLIVEISMGCAVTHSKKVGYSMSQLVPSVKIVGYKTADFGVTRPKCNPHWVTRCCYLVLTNTKTYGKSMTGNNVQLSFYSILAPLG